MTSKPHKTVSVTFPTPPSHCHSVPRAQHFDLRLLHFFISRSWRSFCALGGSEGHFVELIAALHPSLYMGSLQIFQGRIKKLCADILICHFYIILKGRENMLPLSTFLLLRETVNYFLIRQWVSCMQTF